MVQVRTAVQWLLLLTPPNNSIHEPFLVTRSGQWRSPWPHFIGIKDTDLVSLFISNCLWWLRAQFHSIKHALPAQWRPSCWTCLSKNSQSGDGLQTFFAFFFPHKFPLGEKKISKLWLSLNCDCWEVFQPNISHIDWWSGFHLKTEFNFKLKGKGK